MKAQGFRLDTGGRINRSQRLEFTFNGRRYSGYTGDTLASALLANGVHLVARSFKYHRPRGVVTADSSEPNALVQLGEGGYGDPNQRATTVELVVGLEATSQNCWPGVRFDFGAIADRLSAVLPAGFYYKTFMWPADRWKTYEYFIRRAAGLGRVPVAADPDRYEHCHAHCDVLIVGGGPAGLATALAAAQTDARVILADEEAEFGGSLLAETEGGVRIGDAPAMTWVGETVSALAAAKEVRLLPRTTVFGYYDHNFIGMLERMGDHRGPPEGRDLPRQRLWKVRARQVVLATGALERPIVFTDNDRPGVMLASAARAYVNRYAVKPGRRAVVFTNNDSAYVAALDLQAGGVEIGSIVDIRPEPTGALPERARAAGIEVLPGHAVVGTGGRMRIRRATVMPLNDAADRLQGRPRKLACDLLCVSGGWNPAVHLFSQSRGRLVYDPEESSFVPGESAQAETSIGACNGTFALGDCLNEGTGAGLWAAREAGLDGHPIQPLEVAEPGQAPPRTFWRVPARHASAKQFVDFQNDVTTRDLELAVREGYRSIEHVKRYTTTGMGTDQGKFGNIHAQAVVAESLGVEIQDVGTTTFRPPYTPVTFGALAGRDIGKLFDPIRKTPIHSWHERNVAHFEDVGQWQRPWYYPFGGESMRDAVNREVKAVRAGIGILDATTLGKIDIQGPDATELLNRVYTNSWNKLAVGRCRYGLMLGDDGMVMDDGVTVRLGQNHYLMTTTTGNAAAVLGWLEEWLQTEWPDLRVDLTSVTEQWATIGLSGPNSRRLLEELTDIDLDPEAFPHMSVRDGEVAGAPARVCRISFTGEITYEINVPASYGMAVWTQCMTTGRQYQITPYGTEAMHVLRAEKGYIIVGQDTDGSVTPGDLGMDWIVDRGKPEFIGKRGLERSDLQRADRKQLVGLLTNDPEEVLEEGAQIVLKPAGQPPIAMIGHVTSAYESPNVGRSIALAMVKNGRTLRDETLYVPMQDRVVAVTVADSVFFDPDGVRLHG